MTKKMGNGQLGGANILLFRQIIGFYVEQVSFCRKPFLGLIPF